MRGKHIFDTAADFVIGYLAFVGIVGIQYTRRVHYVPDASSD